MKTGSKWWILLFSPKTIAFSAAMLCLLGVAACTADVENPKLPEVPSRLVVVSFISPDDPEVKVSVTRSVSLLSPENTGQPVVVTDAVVLLSDGKDTVQLPYIFNRKLYATRSFSIKPGQQYWLKVTSLSGLKAEATCTVPAKLNQSLSARIDSSEFDDGLNERIYAVELKWQDLPGEGDYYKVDAGLVLKAFQNSPDTTYFDIGMVDDPVARDYQMDLRHFTIRSYGLTLDTYRQERRLLYLQTYLLTTDKPMYEFHRSLTRYQQSNSFTDPVKLYSNIKGGFGVFGAYRRFSLRVPL